MERDMFYINQFDGKCHYTQPYHYEHEDNVKMYDCGEDEPILMQYTGIKDRNGVEIYEGDILKRGHENNPTFYAHIEFQKGGFVGATYPNRNHVIPISALSTCDHDGKGYDTVVGNIYEQPDPSTMTD